MAFMECFRVFEVFNNADEFQLEAGDGLTKMTKH